MVVLILQNLDVRPLEVNTHQHLLHGQLKTVIPLLICWTATNQGIGCSLFQNQKITGVTPLLPSSPEEPWRSDSTERRWVWPRLTILCDQLFMQPLRCQSSPWELLHLPFNALPSSWTLSKSPYHHCSFLEPSLVHIGHAWLLNQEAGWV